MTAPVLAVENLSVSLPRGADRRLAVENLSLEVNSGEVVCIVGESGSGKSVTAAAVMGLLPKNQLRVTQGAIRLLGEDLATAGRRRMRSLRGNRLSMIFQEPMTALNPVHPVGRQIEEVLRCHAWKGDARKRRRRGAKSCAGCARALVVGETSSGRSGSTWRRVLYHGRGRGSSAAFPWVNQASAVMPAQAGIQ